MCIRDRSMESSYECKATINHITNMRSSHKTPLTIQSPHLLGPRPKPSKYLNRLLLEHTPKSLNDSPQISGNGKSEVMNSVDAINTEVKPMVKKSGGSIGRRQTRLEKKVLGFKEKGKVLSTKPIISGKMLESCTKQNKRRAESARDRNAKLSKEVKTLKVLSNKKRNSVNALERNRSENEKSKSTIASGKSKIEKSTYLSKLVKQNKMHSSNLSEKMVVIDMKNWERIKWKEKYDKLELKSKMIKRNSISCLNRNQGSSCSYVMCFYLD
eukprot:TRINITY_DN2374_c0_g1_i7.p1 TRINITY_DN2374_c0_g1~~TRINITY_DN2374_c0_g1_i7.p1  ORF type:complete len:270 (-),score=24.51 TRINITY_DN2374_c0_g1_i7:130-939(-)